MAEANLTKNALAGAMKELILEKPFEKITVSDICEHCGMNRKSFYYHFQDKYDLVNWIFLVGFMEEIAPDFSEADAEGDIRLGWAGVEKLCAYFYREKEFYKRAFQIEGQNSFRDYFHDAVFPAFYAILADILQDDNYGDFFVTLLCDAMVSGLVNWLTARETAPPEEMLSSTREMFIRLARRVVEDVEAEDAEGADPSEL